MRINLIFKNLCIYLQRLLTKNYVMELTFKKIKFLSDVNMWLNMIILAISLSFFHANYVQMNSLKTQILNEFENKNRPYVDTVLIERVDTVYRHIYKYVEPVEEIDTVGGLEVKATVYNAVEEQCDSDPSHTAFMFKLDLANPFKHRIIAVSWDLLKHFPNGSKVKVKGTAYDGIYTVRDKMNPRCKRQIDILINQEMPIGMWKNAKIYKI